MPQAIEEMLETWEGTYKKGLLTFWILLLLQQQPSYPYEMAGEIQRISLKSLSADENSIYRALNRFEGLGLVLSEPGPSPSGPPRKYYRLSESGQKLLKRFIERNILVFDHPQVKMRLELALQNGGSDGSGSRQD